MMYNLNNKLEKEVKNTQRYTTISISEENYWILKKLGFAGDSFNDVLVRLLKNKRNLLKSDSRVETRDQQTLTITNTPLEKGSNQHE